MAINTQTAEELRLFINRIEALNNEKANIVADIQEVFTRAKSTGFDPKIMREIIKIRSKDKIDLEEEEYLINAYKKALGMEEDNA